MRLIVAFPPRDTPSRAVCCSSPSDSRRHNISRYRVVSRRETQHRVKRIFILSRLRVPPLAAATRAMTTAEGGVPIDRIRVKNGYGFNTSALSSSVIGRFDASSEKRCFLFFRFDGTNVNEQQLRRPHVLDFMFVSVSLAMFCSHSNVFVLTRDCCATSDEVSLNYVAVSERCPMSQQIAGCGTY